VEIPDVTADRSITAAGLAELRQEVEGLEGPARRAMAERIKAARELGDLKENADYHIAKEDQAHLETRIKRLRERLDGAIVVEADAAAADETFAFGRTAVVTEGDKTHTWTLVGSTEADLAAGKLSAESPAGQALRDTPVGDEVEVETPRGTRAFRVQSLVD